MSEHTRPAEQVRKLRNGYLFIDINPYQAPGISWYNPDLDYVMDWDRATMDNDDASVEQAYAELAALLNSDGGQG